MTARAQVFAEAALKRKALALAKKLGVKVDVEVDERSQYPDLRAAGMGDLVLTADAPDGFRFAATLTHSVVSSVEDDELRADAWRMLIADLEAGFEPCPADCDCRVEVCSHGIEGIECAACNDPPATEEA